jgi:hypothetical protein
VKTTKAVNSINLDFILAAFTGNANTAIHVYTADSNTLPVNDKMPENMQKTE